MDDIIELSSDTDTYYDNRENLDEELQAILKKYENFDSNNIEVKTTKTNLEIEYTGYELTHGTGTDLETDIIKNKVCSRNKKRFNNDLSPSSKDESENQEVISPQQNLEEKNYNFRSSEEDLNEDIPKIAPKGKQKLSDKIRKKLKKDEKLKQKNEEKSLKLAERLRKKEEAERAKSEKRAMNEVYKSLKPDEAIKQVKCLLDTRITEEVVSGLKDTEIKIKRTAFDTKFPKVTWERDIQMKLIGNNGQLGLNLEEENIPLLYIIDHKELLNLARKEEILSLAQIDSSKATDPSVTLVEFDPNKAQREEEKIIEFGLTELQIVFGWSHRKLKSNSELIDLVHQYTKSFALAPSKRLKASNKGHISQPVSTDCIRVQNNTGHGFAALYLRQLSQFPLASLETAHAVCKLYPTPKSLINSGDSEEVADNLADSQVRRAAGPLSAPRRLGPQLAKKIHVAYTSREPDTILS